MAEEEKIKSQIKSKKRIAAHGEVFTNKREVNAMLDLVKDETEKIESRFLEPACGNGNFLIEVLRRKLDVCNKKSLNDSDWLTNCAIAFSSIYGVELLEDNTLECRKRMYDFFYKKYYLPKFNKQESERYLNVIKYFLQSNIICGDALKLIDSNGNPLIFAEWSWIKDKVQRRDFALSGLLNDSFQSVIEESIEEARGKKQPSLFDNKNLIEDNIENYEDAGLVKENKYPLINFMDLGDLL